jgi:hypothetical protein
MVACQIRCGSSPLWTDAGGGGIATQAAGKTKHNIILAVDMAFHLIMK